MLTTVKAGPAPGGACTAVGACLQGRCPLWRHCRTGGVLASVTTAPANVVVNSNLAAGLAIVTVVDGAMTTAYFTNTSTVAGPGTGTAGAGGMCSGSAGTALFGNAAGAFQVRYASNLTVRDRW